MKRFIASAGGTSEIGDDCIEFEAINHEDAMRLLSENGYPDYEVFLELPEQLITKKLVRVGVLPRDIPEWSLRQPLAEAMFPEKKIMHLEAANDDGGYVGYDLANGTFREFNPFKSADDDYEVLQWIRENYPGECKFQHSLLFGKLAVEYQKGDFARAAINLLGLEL